MKIDFITIKQGYDIIKNAPHIKYYSNKELYRLPNESDIREFNKNEMAILHYIIKELHDVYKIKTEMRIHFLKMRNGYEWNWPHTFIYDKLNVIVLTGKFIHANLFADNIKRFETIYHEIIHLEQKLNESHYDNIYIKYLNFKKIRIENFNLLKDKLLTNPDGYYTSNELWIYMPSLVFPFLSIDLEDKIIYIENINGKWYFTGNIKDLMYDTNLYYAFKLKNGQYLQKQLYHPAEIYAQLKADNKIN